MSSLLDEITKIANAGGTTGSLADHIPIDPDITEEELASGADEIRQIQANTPESLTNFDTGEGFWYNFGRGIDAAASNAAAATLAVRAGFNEAVGDDKEAASLINRAVDYSQGAANYGPEIGRIEDIESFGDFSRWAAGVIPNAFTYLPMVMGPGLVAGGLTRVIGGNILKKKVQQHAYKKLKQWGLKDEDLQAVLGGNVSSVLGKKSAESMQKQLAAYGLAAKRKLSQQQRAAQFGGIWAGGTVLEGGLNVTDIYTETGELQPGIGMAYGTVGGLLSAPIGMYWLNSLRKAGVGNVTKGKAKVLIEDILKKTGVSVGIEVPTEMAQEALNIAAVRHATGKSGPLDPDEKSQIINAGAAALIASGTLAAGGGAVTGAAKAARSGIQSAKQAHERASLEEELGSTAGAAGAATADERIDQSTAPGTQTSEIDLSTSDSARAPNFDNVSISLEAVEKIRQRAKEEAIERKGVWTSYEVDTLAEAIRSNYGDEGFEVFKEEFTYQAGLLTKTRGAGGSLPEAPQIFTRKDGAPFKTEASAKTAATRYRKNNPDAD
ncbi:MAG: hypothetical protein GY918_00690, partial [Gammaproteobacteria bacterium]|nr:hypothetical protein [Gammaproteobacteria bacterium]